MRRRTQFSDRNWKHNQSFCSVDACFILNDPRSKRFQLLNKDKSMQSVKGKKRGIGSYNKHANKNSERQSAKGKKRGIGSYNKHANKGSERQSPKGKKRKFGAYNVVANHQSIAQQAAKGRKRNMRAYNASNNVASNRDSARQSAKGKLRKMGQYNSDVLNKNTERQRLKSQPSNLVTSQGAAALRALNARRSEAAQKRSY